MAREDGQFKKGSAPGRPKGTKNKLTNLKQSFLEAFEKVGGVEELAKWGNKPQNKGQFFQMITKLLPRTVEADLKHTGDLTIVLGGKYKKDKE
ncbi:MAG: hypothetical protein KAS32_25065 [Candidatus Peribacteraceae bacterium]|nr:hypothetical protein [Candidatus Peribacteraceae bacterium]